MNRKVLIIIGKRDGIDLPRFNLNKEIEDADTKMIETIKNRGDVDLTVVGWYDKEFDMSSLNSAITELDPIQPLTIIHMGHGTMEDKEFKFLLDDRTRVSAREIFGKISERMGDTPVDIISEACHGGAMLFDKDILPKGSTVVSLTDAFTINHGGAFERMQNAFDQFRGELTAYNILQFYLAGFLTSKYHPQIGISGGNSYSLDSELSKRGSHIEFDEKHFESLGSPEKYKEVFRKIKTLGNNVFAVDYGAALSIVLNDLKNGGNLSELKSEGMGL